MDDPPPLQYGTPDTVFGIVTERLPDGGVKITVPRQNALLDMAAKVVPALKFNRLIVTLDSNSFTLVDYSLNDHVGEIVWPLEQVGQIHVNRYDGGVYVTIAGRDSFNLIPDCPKEIVQYVGDTLEQTLAAMRAVAKPQVELGPPSTQFGIVVQPLVDGGVRIKVPYGLDRVLGGFLEPTTRLIQRCIITLDRRGLTIVEDHPNTPGPKTIDGNRTSTSNWPLAELGEIRHNRYGRGVYVSIPGKANFDLLTDIRDNAIRFVADTLEQTLARLRSEPAK